MKCALQWTKKCFASYEGTIHLEVNRENLRCLSEIAVKWKNVKYLNY